MPRAKRSEATTEQMRQQLVTAARDMIAQGGLSALTARALAARLNWAVGTIYTVCPTLDAITLQANAEELSDLHDAVERALSHATDDPRRRILTLAETYVRFSFSRPRNWAAIFEREAEGDPPDWYRARQTALFGLLETELSALLSHTADPQREAGKAARALWAALQGLCALALAGHIGRISETSVEELAEYLVTTFLAGLRARA
ncbi:MAG: WHG domain-containing protein [Neomegalonema sp.]|nr:WHG domain-containing protein [Neomegalonema sp.]